MTERSSSTEHVTKIESTLILRIRGQFLVNFPHDYFGPLYRGCNQLVSPRTSLRPPEQIICCSHVQAGENRRCRAILYHFKMCFDVVTDVVPDSPREQPLTFNARTAMGSSAALST